MLIKVHVMPKRQILKLIFFCLGFYQPAVGKATCDQCPTGYYCDPHELNNATGIIVPVPCPEGYYCPLQTEFSTQNPCAPGSWSNTTRLTAQGKKHSAHKFTLLPSSYPFAYFLSHTFSLWPKKIINYAFFRHNMNQFQPLH